ncbi:hypothetical protein [Alishewanella longhuensis]
MHKVIDPFIKAAVALYKADMQREAEQEELAGKIQQAYASYMRAKDCPLCKRKVKPFIQMLTALYG